jgi:hypothetical protein
MTGYDTKLPSGNVRYSVAIEGKADLAKRHGPTPPGVPSGDSPSERWLLTWLSVVHHDVEHHQFRVGFEFWSWVHKLC